MIKEEVEKEKDVRTADKVGERKRERGEEEEYQNRERYTVHESAKREVSNHTNCYK